MITDTKTLAAKLRATADQILLGQPARDCIEAAYRLEQLEKAADRWRARHAATLADLTDCKRELSLTASEAAEWQNMAHSRKLQADAARRELDAAMRELEQEKQRDEYNGKLAHNTAIELMAERALANRLRKSAQAIVDRWETPFWKDAPHTGKFMRSLDDALAAWKETRRIEPPFNPIPSAEEIDAHLDECAARSELDWKPLQEEP